MTVPKNEKFAPRRVPVAEVYKELGDPNTWNEDDASYSEAVNKKRETMLLSAARNPDDPADAESA